MADGSKYEGEWVHGLRQGFGVQTWKNGNAYRGEFRDGFANGRG